MRCLLACELCSALGVFGCASEATPTEDVAPQADVVDAEADGEGEAADTEALADYRSGTPWLCIDLDGVVTPDTPADVRDDFALAANKDAILALELPEGAYSAGPMADLEYQTSEDVKQMFLDEAPASHDARLAYDLYWLILDWDGRDKVGMEPLAREVRAVEAIGDVEALADHYLKTPAEDVLYPLWSCAPVTDVNDSGRKILEVSNSGLLLGDSPEYAELTDYGSARRDAIGELTRKMLVWLGYTQEEAELKVERCLEFEALLAPHVYSGDEKRRPDFDRISNNRYTEPELKEAEGALPILELAGRLGYPSMDAYLIPDTGFLGALNDAVSNHDIELAKDYVICHGVSGAAEHLDRQCDDWANEVEEALMGPADRTNA